MPLIRKSIPPSTPSAPPAGDVLHNLGSSNPDERWAAAREAARTPDIAAELAAAVPAETDPRVREAMFTSLVRMGPATLAEYVLPLLRSTEAALRMGASDALASSAAAVRELLPSLMRDRDVDLRILSCDLARRLSSAEATGHLCALLLDERNANVCAAAVDVLAEAGDPAALPVLARCAQRFVHVPFLSFSIQIAIDRLTSQPTPDRG